MRGSHKLFWLIKITVLMTVAAGAEQSATTAAGAAPAADEQVEHGPAAPTGLPAAVFEELIRSTGGAPLTIRGARLGVEGRMLMALLAAVSAAGGVVVCRYWAGRVGTVNGGDAIFLLFGLFSAIAAVCLATVVTGNVRMHVAAVLCTMASGFGIGGFLLAQFNWSAQWLGVGADRADQQGDDTEREDK